MLFFDMSGLTFQTVLDYHAKTKEQADMPLLRHLIINKLRLDKSKLKEFAPKNEDIVLCFDSRKYWRKEKFEYYKGARKAARDASTFDWNGFFPLYDQLKSEFREYFPLRCLEVEGAEADDLMGILAPRFAPHEKVCVASSDKDMVQLQLLDPRIKQYSFHHRKFLTPKNTDYSLFEHVVKGDSGDGIPNVFSDSDTLMVKGKRQKPVGEVLLAKLAAQGGMHDPENWCPDVDTLEKFRRNRDLIDLSRIPHDLAERIVAAYDSYEIPRNKLFGYLTGNRLKNILKEGGF